MQARAVFEAAAAARKQGIKANPEIMIPLVGFKKELDLQVAIVHQVAAASRPRRSEAGLHGRHHDRSAAGRADGRRKSPRPRNSSASVTNDLTPDDPRHEPGRLRLFPSLLPGGGHREEEPLRYDDQTGVGQLMKIAIEKGRSTRPNIQAGHLRRTRRRPRLREVLPQAGPHLRLLQPLPRPRSPPSRRPGSHRGSQGEALRRSG